MVDLAQLSVSQWLLVLWHRDIGVKFELEIENMVAESLRPSEGSEEKCGSEWLGGFEELDWEVLLRLGGC